MLRRPGRKNETPAPQETPRFPHCDDLVLHAPGDCEFCDLYPEEQAQRLLDGVNFSGQDDPNKKPCPSLARRPAEAINAWGGNVTRPTPQRVEQKVQKAAEDLERLPEELGEDDA